MYYKLRDPMLVAGVNHRAVDQPSTRVVQIAPNPLRDLAIIEFRIVRPAMTKISIFDVSGRLVWHRNLGVKRSGTHQVAWDGRNASGREVSPGVYLVGVETGNNISIAKMVVIR